MINNNRKSFLIIAVLFTLALMACRDAVAPRPTGYFRIDLPEKHYHKVDTLPFPFAFDLPQYAIADLRRTNKNKHFLNIDFPRYGAKIHLSYLPVHGNLNEMLEDSRTLVYKHVVKAQDILENTFEDTNKRVFGTYFQIDGNAASGSQFYLTDSVHHFLRGALYFDVEPNYDSIYPVQNFIKADIQHLIESFRWVDSTQLKVSNP